MGAAIRISPTLGGVTSEDETDGTVADTDELGVMLGTLVMLGLDADDLEVGTVVVLTSTNAWGAGMLTPFA